MPETTQENDVVMSLQSRSLTFCLLCFITLSVQALRTDASESAAEIIQIRDVPHVTQKPDFCGEACLASWLQKLGSSVDQDDVFDVSGLDPSAGRGCYTKELVAAAKNIGFNVGPVWYRIPADDVDSELDHLWRQTVADLKKSIPSILCMRTRNDEQATEHFRLILGYDRGTDEVIYHEPAARDGAYQRMKRKTLMELWPLKYSAQQWTAIRIPLRIQGNPKISSSSGFTDADYAQHIMNLKARLPNRSFHLLIQRPFVVVSDESPATMKRRAEGVVNWATTKLKESYFEKDPNQILDIWLFRDKESYDTNTIRVFGRQPSTPFGYYSSTDGALVMNIATGGGTLVHEIVHPFIESNFPKCPSWFNEGLGSLYEQSSTREGKIVGLTNWRLAGLQRAIKAKKVPSFAELCSTTTNQFYNEDSGTNYAQARYLCYYLQEQGLLRTYYHKFVANQKKDPTGYQTLMSVLKTKDMERFKMDWEKYVMKLRFPG